MTKVTIIKPTSKDLEHESKNSRFKSSVIKNCSICGSEFKYGRSSQISCGLCKIRYNCFECKISIENTMNKGAISSKARRILVNEIKSGIFTPRFCSRKCSLTYRNKTRKIYCSTCNKVTAHGAIGCMICHNNSINKVKYCDICGEDTMHNSSRCIICFNKSDNIGFKILKCRICNKNTSHLSGKCIICNDIKAQMSSRYCSVCNKTCLHNGSRCSSCDPWPGAFDRETYYSTKIKSLNIDIDGHEISIDDINTLIGVPGVWSKELESGEVLDVAQTQDIGSEMLFSIRALDKGRQNLSLSDEEARELPYIQIKYRDMARYSPIIFKLISVNINSKEERELIEAHYAHAGKARHWHPAPGQNIPV